MTKKPNILYILSDQHRMDCLGIYGNKEIQTPYLDKLAEEGCVFSNSFCSFPLCTPSRYSCITGLHSREHMGWGNHSTIPENLETFPKMLRDFGYNTKAIGKMHYTPTYVDVGFNEMELAEQHGPGRHDDDYHRYLRDKGLYDRIDLLDQVDEFREKAEENYWTTFGALESNLPEEHHSTTWTAERALMSIEQWKEDESNFLMVGFVKPHHPFDPPMPWANMYDPDKISILPGWSDVCPDYDFENDEGRFSHHELDENSMKLVLSKYYATITHMDYHIGRIVELLKKKGIYDDTLIIYSSDHGEYMGYHHMLLKCNYMYEPVVKVPLIIKYPGNTNVGKFDERLVSNIDIAPTVLKTVGIEPNQFMSGLNLRTTEERDALFIHYMDEHTKTFDRKNPDTNYGISADYPTKVCDYRKFYDEYMVRTKNKKLLYRSDREKSQFFDLEKDPYEFNNLFHNEEYQTDIQEHISLLTEWVLFESKVPMYLNEDAPVIKEDNVPMRNDNHRQESMNYFWEKEGLKRK